LCPKYEATIAICARAPTLALVAIGYGSKPGDWNWNPTADLDGNGEINIVDITMVARDYGKTVIDRCTS
jgi:hypothetical protein